MYNKKLTAAGRRMGKRSLVMMTAAALSFGCHKSNVNDKDLRDFDVVNLVANSDEYHPKNHIDLNLINGFGIAWSPTNVAWVNSVLGRASELYNLEGDSIAALPRVKIPSRLDTIGGLPCGIVFSGGQGFRLGTGTAAFIFTGFDGVLSAWNGGKRATRMNNPTRAETSYTGLAIGSSNGRNFIYGANFGEKKIDVWDTVFHKVQMSFKDYGIPDAYSPYNIQAVGDKLFVMYGELATSGQSKGHGVAGAGKGFVSVFNTDGSFVARFASKGTLNLPWGVTMAPGSFLQDQDIEGEDDGHGGYFETKTYNGGGNNNHGRDPKDPVILVGNFGDGRINVYTQDGRYLGQLQAHKHPLVIEGLWALTFPPAPPSSAAGRLYFSAGPSEEMDGVFGYILKR